MVGLGKGNFSNVFYTFKLHLSKKWKFIRTQVTIPILIFMAENNRDNLVLFPCHCEGITVYITESTGDMIKQNPGDRGIFLKCLTVNFV